MSLFLPLEIIAWAVIIGGWTFMWLTWSFEADVRAWIAALFPRKWMGGTPRSHVAIMSPHSLDKWLVASNAPLFVCQLMSCPKCYSAHVSAYGSILVAVVSGLPILAIPLAWAFGAGIGYILYDYTKRPHKNHSVPTDRRDPDTVRPHAG